MIDTTKLVEGERYLVRWTKGRGYELASFYDGRFNCEQQNEVSPKEFDLAIPLALALKAEKMREMLVKHQYADRGHCPECDGYACNHAEDCALAALIADAGGGE